MYQRSISIFSRSIAIGILSVAVCAQSGGPYVILQSVIAGGGGDQAGGTYAVTSTTGEPAAGTSSSAAGYAARGGFWQALLGPTGAFVFVGGRVLARNNRPLGNVLVSVTDGTSTRYVRTNPQGFFQFEDLEAGQTYILQAQSARNVFAPMIISARDNIANLIITPQQ